MSPKQKPLSRRPAARAAAQVFGTAIIVIPASLIPPPLVPRSLLPPPLVPESLLPEAMTLESGRRSAARSEKSKVRDQRSVVKGQWWTAGGRARVRKTRETRMHAEEPPLAAAFPVSALAELSAPVAKPPPIRKAPLDIPPLLLEGDQPEAPPASGPGERFVVGPTPFLEPFSAGEHELPEAYGTRELSLTARDPHWLYANWDFTARQLHQHNAQAAAGHLSLRLFYGEAGGELATQVEVHPESRNWFVPVQRADQRYVAELGYLDRAGGWVSLAASAGTKTPPDALSKDTTVQFATIPHDVPLVPVAQSIQEATWESPALAELMEVALVEMCLLKAEEVSVGPFHLTEPMAMAPLEFDAWTPAQEQALAEIISLDEVRQVWTGSLEVSKMVQRQLAGEILSQAAGPGGAVSSPLGAGAAVTSPMGGAGAGPRKGFWFNINAELIIYGATEPDAQVTIAGRPIRLRPDGSFSFRFALPDGEFELPATAVSADGEDARQAKLHFRRDTEYRGDVGRHPQDERLQPPTAAAVG